MQKTDEINQSLLSKEQEIIKSRKLAHAEHIDYFYGDYWCIFMDKDKKCFLEFDKGHFASEFVIKEISLEDYNSLKTDKSQYQRVIQTFNK